MADLSSMESALPSGTEELDVCPMSFAEQRLWFLSMLQPDSLAYHIPLSWRIRGPIDPQVLERALREIQRRHETLRTTFDVVDEEPVQLVSHNVTLTLPMVDLRHIDTEERSSVLEERLHAEEVRLFDLQKGPVLRTTLFQIDEEDFVFSIVFHHIVADGWSLGVFHRELTTLYEAFLLGRESPLEALPIQYADFAEWQREYLTGERLETQLSYWRNQLSDLPELDFPSDRPRPPFQTYRALVHSFILPEDLSQALTNFCTTSGATLSMVVQATYAALLSRYSGQEDVVVGIPIANRNRSEIEGLIGFFVNSLAIRTSLAGNPSFSELLSRVRTAALGAYAHQDLPFEKLVEELERERDPSRNPIFQVWCAVQNASVGAVVLRGLNVEAFNPGVEITRFDLELHVLEAGGSYRLDFLYKPDLFDQETIVRFGEHFQTLLRFVLSSPDRPVNSGQILTDAEIHQVTAGWNDTDVDFGAEGLVHSFFETQAERTPDAPALRFQDQVLSYAELEDRTRKVASFLRTRGVGPDTLVGVYMERSVAMVVALIGILRSGGAYVPLEPAYPPKRLIRMVEDAKPHSVLTQGSFRNTIDSVLEGAHGIGAPLVYSLDEDWEAVAAGGQAALPDSVCEPESLAYVIYTSGSTGQPKGVMVNHSAVANRLLWMQSEYGLTSSDRVLQKTPFGFDVSVWEFFWPTGFGAELIVAAPEGHKDPRYLAELIEDSKITTLHFVPSMLKVFLAETEIGSGSPLRRVYCSGEALTGDLAKEFLERFPGVELHNLYGPTEAAVDVTYFQCSKEDERRNVPIGRPVANTQVYVLDDHMRPLPIGVFGELFIGGVQVARGYLGRPDLTSERFTPDRFTGKTDARLYRTGDVVRYLPDGNIEFKGRADFQVKIRGNRIECGEIEIQLTADNAVNQAVVLAREDQPGDQRLAAYLVLDREARKSLLAGSGDVAGVLMDEWEQVYDDTYATPGQSGEVSFIGWNSSYTGKAIPTDEMNEWVDATCHRLCSWPHERVLELGCGNGLLLFKIAPDSERYIGSDLSTVAVQTVRKNAEALGLGQVTALHRRADDVSGLDTEDFQLVVLNSVAQYFPSIDYLAQVLDGALDVVPSGGRVFVGDVRSLPLLRAFYTSVCSFRSGSIAHTPELREEVQRMALADRELVVHPDFFRAWGQARSGVTAVDILPKRGHSTNEMTTFRYDVVIHVGTPTTPSDEFDWIPWEPHWTSSEIRRVLNVDCPDALGIVGIPNKRVSSLLRDTEALFGAGSGEGGESSKTGEASEGLHPEDLWRAGADLPFNIDVRWTDGERHMAVLFRHGEKDDGSVPEFPVRPVRTRPWADFANDPLRDQLERQIVPGLKESLADVFPDYMVPSDFVVLGELPLTLSGKLDRKALPSPSSGLRKLATDYVAPRNATEEQLAEIWRDLLQVDRVGIEDSFFDLGGHSLMATKLMSRIRLECHVEVPLRTLFENPTIAGLAPEIVQVRASGIDPERLSGMLALLEEES